MVGVIAEYVRGLDKGNTVKDGEKPFLILVTGLPPKDADREKELIVNSLSVIPNSSVTFVDRPWVGNIVPLIDHYSLVIATHPNLLRYLFPGPFNGWEKKTHGWWAQEREHPVKFYSTTDKTLELDLGIIVRRYVNEVD